jgi:methylmalonyl-CoA mutase cobalamin-binding subunit
VLLRRIAATFGVLVFLDAMAAPLLRRMGDELRRGRMSAAQEHLATAVLQRVLDAIVQFLIAPQDAPDLLLATIAGEQHRIEATLAAVAAAAQGWRVTYLGAGLPAGEIASAAAAAGAHAVSVSVVDLAERDRVLGELRTLRVRLPVSVPLLVGGAGAADLAPELGGAGIRVVEDLTALRAALRHGSEPEAGRATA